jgi:hypothetical protein
MTLKVSTKLVDTGQFGPSSLGGGGKQRVEVNTVRMEYVLFRSACSNHHGDFPMSFLPSDLDVRYKPTMTYLGWLAEPQWQSFLLPRETQLRGCSYPTHLVSPHLHMACLGYYVPRRRWAQSQGYSLYYARKF